jgi:hypothetical protein
MRRSPWRWLAGYGAYTGAATGYGFFAPVVPDARRIRIRVLSDGRWTPVDPPLHGPETAVRLATVADLTMFDEIAPGVAASFAAYAFAQVPSSRAALVEVDYYDVPTAGEYRQGVRPEWKLLRVFSFLPPR